MLTFARYFTIYLLIGYLFTYTVFGVFLIEGVIASLIYLFFIWVSRFIFSKKRRFSYDDYAISRVDRIINICLCLSLLASFLIVLDRYIIFGSDLLSMGVARLRVEKNEYGSSGTIFSFIGNLFVYCYFVALYLFVAFYKVFPKPKINIYYSLFFVLLLLSVYFTGGRTPLVLAILSVLAGYSFNRSFTNGSLSLNRINPLNIIILFLLALFAFGYIFYLRSEAFNSGDSFSYVTNMCFHLTSFDEILSERCSTLGFFESYENIFSDFLNYSIAILLYAFHGLWIVNDIGISFLPTSDSIISVAGITFLLRRFGFEFVTHEYVGYFVPFYSSISHDLGFVFGLPFLLGIPIICRLLMTRSNVGINKYGVFYFLGFVTVALTLFINPLNFPFYILSLTGIFVVVLLQIKGR